MNTAPIDSKTGSDSQEVQIEKRKRLTYAIIAQAYVDVKRYWKYAIGGANLSSSPGGYHRAIQDRYLRREYERSLDFFLTSYEGHTSYMLYLLSLVGEGDEAAKDILDTVHSMKDDVERFSALPLPAMTVGGPFFGVPNAIARQKLTGMLGPSPSGRFSGQVALQ